MAITTMSDVERNAIADGQAARAGYLGLHTADPGTTGADEAAGVYVRQPPTFNAAGADGPLGSVAQPATVGVAWSSQVAFDVGAGTYTHYGIFDGGGAFMLGHELDVPQSPGSPGVIPLSIGVGEVLGV